MEDIHEEQEEHGCEGFALPEPSCQTDGLPGDAVQ